MARNLISGDAALRTLKPGDPRQRITDGDGLYLLVYVRDTYAPAWRFAYTFTSKRKTLSLGRYPDTSLQLARTKANECRQLLAEGIDPSGKRKAAKAGHVAASEADKRRALGLPEPGSFKAVALEWVATIHRDQTSERHAATTLRRLEKDVFPFIGDLPIISITPPKLLEVLRRIEARGARETTHRVKNACGQIFRYGISTGQAERDPSADLRGVLRPVAPAVSMPAVTDPVAVREVLLAIDTYTGQPTTRAALQLAPLLFQRPGNLRTMEWTELDLDGAEPTWTIPSSKMKRSIAGKTSGKPHVVPLAPQAVAILQALKPLTSHRRYCFPSNRGNDRPMSDMTLGAALQRLGLKGMQTAHGMRAMARTMLAERLNVDERVIEAQLAHEVPDALGKAYNRTSFLAQRRQMMTRWADYLDWLRTGAEVIPMPKAIAA